MAAAEALVFIAPVYFIGFPAILKGWVERVFSLGFAFALKPEAWRGDIRGRMPLLHHRKALILNTTFFDEASYDDRLRDAIDTWASKNKEAAAAELSAVLGLDKSITDLYLSRARFGTAPVTREILAEQQAIADTFFDLKLIPKKLNLLHAAPVDLL